MNYNTLHMPLEHADLAHRADPSLGALLTALLTRDASARLGASGGASELKAQPFFALTEWRLLEGKRLPAPYLPSKELVYAKDFIAPLSQDEVVHVLKREPPAAAGAPANSEPPPQLDLARWRFVCGGEAFKQELAECAAVVDPKVLLKATKASCCARPVPVSV